MARTRNRRNKGSSRTKDSDTTQKNAVNTKSADTSQTSNEGSQADEAGKKNDVSWYSLFPEILFSASNFPWSYPIGKPIIYGRGDIHTAGSTSAPIKVKMPTKGKSLAGICTVTVKHTVPGKGKQTDAINVAANSFYTHLRVVNSGRKNYDPVDAMMYNLALADLYSLVFFYQKIYGLGLQYSQQNAYVGRVMCEQLGVNWDDLVKNLANFRYWLNSFTKKLQAYAVPSNIPYYLRRAFMYSGIYLENDKENIKDQLYQFKPEGFFQFALETTGAGYLQFTPWQTAATLRDVSSMISYAEGLILNVWADEDFALISGDIIKAYGSNLITIDEIPADFTVMPVHNPEILAQMKHAVCHNLVTSRNITHAYNPDGNHTCYFGDVYQNEHGMIYCYEAEEVSGISSETKLRAMMALYCDKILSSEFSLGSPEYVAEASRLMTMGSGETMASQDELLTFPLVDTVCTEIATKIALATLEDAGTVTVNTWYHNYLEDSTSAMGYLVTAGQFKFMPMSYEFAHRAGEDNVSEITTVTPFTNVDAYTLVGAEQLKKLHDVCALSLFYVPGVAHFIESMSK